MQRGKDRPQKPVLFTEKSHKISPKAQEIPLHNDLTFYRCCHNVNGHLVFVYFFSVFLLQEYLSTSVIRGSLYSQSSDTEPGTSKLKWRGNKFWDSAVLSSVQGHI